MKRRGFLSGLLAVPVAAVAARLAPGLAAAPAAPAVARGAPLVPHDGELTTYFQHTPPDYQPRVGDLWFDDSLAIYRYNGIHWEGIDA